jgi:hypothetical protein
VSLIRVVAILAVLLFAGGSVASAQGKVPDTTLSAKRIERQQVHIRSLQATIRFERNRANHLEAAMSEPIATQLPLLSGPTLFNFVTIIGDRLSLLAGFHVGVEQSVDDRGTYDTWRITQAHYFPVLF